MDHLNGTLADVAIVWARADDGIRGFLVEKGTPGFTTSDIHGKEVVDAGFGDLEPRAFRLPRGGRPDAAGRARMGWKGPLGCLDPGALRHRMGDHRRGGWIATNPARQYTILRKQFDDRPIASHQLVQEKLADMITEITKAQLLALQCGRLKAIKGGWSRRTCRCSGRANNVGRRLPNARQSRDLLGANGITDEVSDHAGICATYRNGKGRMRGRITFIRW